MVSASAYALTGRTGTEMYGTAFWPTVTYRRTNTVDQGACFFEHSYVGFAESNVLPHLLYLRIRNTTLLKRMASVEFRTLGHTTVAHSKSFLPDSREIPSWHSCRQARPRGTQHQLQSLPGNRKQVVQRFRAPATVKAKRSHFVVMKNSHTMAELLRWLASSSDTDWIMKERF
jgi:hypothetical protein